MHSSITANSYDNVKTAELYTIKFDNLFGRDMKELQNLVGACERDGFFYLDLQGVGSERFWEDLDQVGEITRHWFDQPQAVKMKTPTLSLAHGYVFQCTPLKAQRHTESIHKTDTISSFKAVGNQSGAIQTCKDGFEALKVSTKLPRGLEALRRSTAGIRFTEYLIDWEI
jgi:isopenicillin N synthase-like dioxygenase